MPPVVTLKFQYFQIVSAQNGEPSLILAIDDKGQIWSNSFSMPSQGPVPQVFSKWKKLGPQEPE